MRNAMHRNTTAQPTAIGLRYLADLPSIANIEFGSLSQFPSWDLGPLGHLALVPWPTCLSRSVATWSYLQHLTAPFCNMQDVQCSATIIPFLQFQRPCSQALCANHHHQESPAKPTGPNNSTTMVLKNFGDPAVPIIGRIVREKP